MKCEPGVDIDPIEKSLPLQGAWIEIIKPELEVVGLNVAPFTGGVD